METAYTNDWASLESDDWSAAPAPAAPAAKIDAAAQLGMGVARSAATVARYTCDKCRGSGKFYSYTGRLVGDCMKCHGGGLLKTDPAVSAQRRAKAQATVAAKRTAWAEAHAAEISYLAAQRESFEFAQSMRAAIAQYGSLTDGQLAAVRRLMERSAERAAVQAAKPADAQVAGAGFERMLAAFGAAKASGLKYPKFTAGGVTFSLASATSKNAGCLYAKAGDTYLGKINAGGGFFKAGDCPAEQAANIATICADPFAAAVMHGKQTGRCSCCGRELENPESVALGIGPICREKWGM